MKQFSVYFTFKIQADNEDDAEELAMEAARNGEGPDYIDVEELV